MTAPRSESYGALTEHDRGVLEGLQLALAALDGYILKDTAHSHIGRLLACSECHHAPERHESGGVCQERVFIGRGPLVPCPCAEYEVGWLTLTPRATCFCGEPSDRERVHRAHECLPWVTSGPTGSDRDGAP